MRTKLSVVAIAALMVVFAILAIWSAIGFLQAPQLVAKVLGVAVLGIVAVGLWTLWREVRFGLAMEKLGRTLESEGGLPEDDLPRTPAGRIDRTAADAQFQVFRAEAEAAPDDWRSWYRLSLGYDASGDRSRARRAMRDAIRLHADSTR
ncbi:hypothetical protein [Citricoccus sp. GCM10030269]|uniref:hypothetical protein n=1 Tax=Citricoccus sp. GCM10030269 TaxID=3273388 RepID=UPI003617B585